jgi:polyketide biosynthesis enoyl-CoA hydratase PksH
MYETLLVESQNNRMTITLNRIEQQNAISSTLLTELNLALDEAERNPHCQIVILKGQQGIFCSGMDLNEYVQLAKSQETMRAWATLYMQTLKRLSTSPKIIAAAINGKVMAGGVGLVAASDFVIATDNASFKLSEALWGLIPGMVAPYLIRKVGFQSAYSLALTTKTITAKEAHNIHLVDVISERIGEELDSFLQRMERVKAVTVKELKSYFRKLSIDNATELLAIEETVQRMLDPTVQATIRNYVENKKLPWDK